MCMPKAFFRSGLIYDLASLLFRWNVLLFVHFLQFSHLMKKKGLIKEAVSDLFGSAKFPRKFMHVYIIIFISFEMHITEGVCYIIIMSLKLYNSGMRNDEYRVEPALMGTIISPFLSPLSSACIYTCIIILYHFTKGIHRKYCRAIQELPPQSRVFALLISMLYIYYSYVR